MTKFKDKKLQSVFELFSQKPPSERGSGLSRFYFNGLEFPNKENLKPDRGTFAYAAWAAGKAASKLRKVAL
jgi:hypothetical protein